MSEPTTFQIEFKKKVILGKGMCGKVYKGLWKSSQGVETIVAVKRIRLIDLTERELKGESGDSILSKLDHPNIVKVFHTEIQSGKR